MPKLSSSPLDFGSSAWLLSLDPQLGGAIRRLQWNGRDILRCAPDAAVDPLEMACFPLAPFSNRIGDGGFFFLGKRYDLPANMQGVPDPIHGFSWQRAWELGEHGDAVIRLRMEDRESPWPQPYVVDQAIMFDSDSVHIQIRLTNVGDGPMPAGIGLHPYFPKGRTICEIMPGAMWEKNRDDMPARLNPSHRFQGPAIAMKDIRLDHSFSGWDGVAVLDVPNQGLKIHLAASETLRELVIYSPEDEYFCIEPVSHLTNAIHATSKVRASGWRILEAGESLEGTLSLSVEEYGDVKGMAGAAAG